MTPVSHVAIAALCLLLVIGAHFTYTRVPIGIWLRDTLGLQRNPYDRAVHFAGGFVGYLSQSRDFTFSGIKRAMIHGSVVASYTVEEFGPARLAEITPEDVLERYNMFQELTRFEPVTHLEGTIVRSSP